MIEQCPAPPVRCGPGGHARGALTGVKQGFLEVGDPGQCLRGSGSQRPHRPPQAARECVQSLALSTCPSSVSRVTQGDMKLTLSEVRIS